MSPTALPLPDPEALLATAEARLRRQAGYARPLAGRSGRVLEAGLAAARAALAEALRPGALWRAVAAEALPVTTPRLAEAVAEGAQPVVWLCTLGHDAQAVAAALGEDRMRAHLAGDLAVQALFAAARAVHAGLAAAHPGRRLVRIALRDAQGGRWDAAAVSRLVPLLGPAPLGVRAEPGGGLMPAHTLLGVVAVRRAGAAGERP